MEVKESVDETIDYSFISKYIRDDSTDGKADVKKESVGNFSIKNFQTQDRNVVEVFGAVGEEEGYSGNSNFNKKPWQEDSELSEESDEENEKIESGPESKIATEAKSEFIKHLEDDSLTVDTCNRLNHDWKK